jgi:hypothetical protein
MGNRDHLGCSFDYIALYPEEVIGAPVVGLQTSIPPDDYLIRPLSALETNRMRLDTRQELRVLGSELVSIARADNAKRTVSYGLTDLPIQPIAEALG